MNIFSKMFKAVTCNRKINLYIILFSALGLCCQTIYRTVIALNESPPPLFSSSHIWIGLLFMCLSAFAMFNLVKGVTSEEEEEEDPQITTNNKLKEMKEKLIKTSLSYFFLGWIFALTLFSVYQLGHNIAVGEPSALWATIATISAGVLFYLIIKQKKEIHSFYRNIKPLGTAQLKKD